MTPGVRPLVAGNWKMNGVAASLGEIETMRAAIDEGAAGEAEALICPPLTLLALAADRLRGGRLALGAQDCHVEAGGAFTGDVSAEMIADAGGSYVIVGHSERRAGHGESDALVRAKAGAALRAGVIPIVCCGETREERSFGQAIEIVGKQLLGSLPWHATPARLVVAYEPIWAIGTGLIPTYEDVAAMHAIIRALLGEVYGEAGARFRVLYGGSVKPANARELLTLANVDGALVGGASLKAKEFLAIAGVYAYPGKSERPMEQPF